MAVSFSPTYPRIGLVSCSPPGTGTNSAASYFAQADSTLGQTIDYTFVLFLAGSTAPTAAEVLDVSNTGMTGFVFRGTNFGVASGVEAEFNSNFLANAQDYDVYFVAVESGTGDFAGPEFLTFTSADCSGNVGGGVNTPDVNGEIPDQSCALNDPFDLDVRPFFSGDIDNYYLLVGPAYLGAPGSLIAGGVFAAIASTAGVFDVVVRAENDTTGATADQRFTKTTIAPPVWTGLTPGPAVCVEGQAMVPLDISSFFTGTVVNYVISGEPTGITISTAGVLAGTPAAGTALASPYGITITAVGPGGSDSFVLTKSVVASSSDTDAPVGTQIGLNNITASGAECSVEFTDSSGPITAYAVAVLATDPAPTSADIIAGVGSNGVMAPWSGSSGALASGSSWTAVATGLMAETNYVFYKAAMDSVGNVSASPLGPFLFTTLSDATNALSTTGVTPSNTVCVVGQNSGDIDSSIMFQGGVAPIVYSAVGLPAGFAIDSASGIISGTPAGEFTVSVTVTAVDANTSMVQASFTKVARTTQVTSAQTIPWNNWPGSMAGRSKSDDQYPLCFFGGIIPRMVGLVGQPIVGFDAGSLFGGTDVIVQYTLEGAPAGITIDAATGVISGSPVSATVGAGHIKPNTSGNARVVAWVDVAGELVEACESNSFPFDIC